MPSFLVPMVVCDWVKQNEALYIGGCSGLNSKITRETQRYTGKNISSPGSGNLLMVFQSLDLYKKVWPNLPGA